MKGHGTKLGRRKEATIKALLENDTLADAARAVGIGEVTLWRWLQEPYFKEAFRNAKRRVLDQAITNLQKATGKAIGALLSVVEDKKAPASARVSGAKVILETAIKAVEVEDLESRVEKVEQVLKERRMDSEHQETPHTD